MTGEIKVIYEDSYILALNKPAGILVHGDGRSPRQGSGQAEHTIADWLLEKYPEIAGVGEPLITPQGEEILRPGIVHRLDRETSGVLVVAKDQETFLHLKEEFKTRQMKKTYRAFVYGVMKNDEGVIDRPIGRSRSHPTLWSAEYGAKGSANNGGELREAVTEYKVISRGEGVTYLEAYPKTGRTHQIRVHLKAVGHSVVCDKLYAPNKPSLLDFSRLALHAYSLEVSLPGEGRILLEADLPEDFQKAERILREG